jgi:hypothetical protein
MQVLFFFFFFFYMPLNLTWDQRLYFPPKEGVLRIFIARNNPSRRPGLNLQTLVLMASTLIFTPLRRRFVLLLSCVCTLVGAQVGEIFLGRDQPFSCIKHHAMQECEGRFGDKVPRILYFAIGERSVSRSGRFIPWTHGYPLSREAVWAPELV